MRRLDVTPACCAEPGLRARVSVDADQPEIKSTKDSHFGWMEVQSKVI